MTQAKDAMKIIQKSATLPCPERDDHVLQLLPPLPWLHTVLLLAHLSC